MHDVERIKRIIMSDDQIRIFNSLPKPVVNISRTPLPANKKGKGFNAEVDPPIFQDMFEKEA